MAMSTINALAKLISESVTSIENVCITQNMPIPSLEETFSLESEVPRMHPDVSEAISLVIAASAQLIAILRPAPVTLLTTAAQVHVSSALRVAVETNVVEILRDAGPQGLHVQEIASKNYTEPGKLARILRLLCAEHIFQEISPDVFANNRISSTLDTGKAVDDLRKKPEDKFSGTNGIAAATSHFTDEVLKSSAYLCEAITHPELAKSVKPSDTAFNLALKTNLPLFAWFEQPGNEYRLNRFGIAFEGGSCMIAPNAILQGYDWTALAKGSTIVDVGGGVGTESLKITKANPDLKIIVQDRNAVIPKGVQFFENTLPDALTSGQVQFQAHDFFTSQPVKNARVYFMRMILHDWSDSACIEILKNIRSAAGPDSELIIIETLISYACPTKTTTEKDIPGAIGKVPPAPLLPNSGHANIFMYLLDIQMMALFNGTERTVTQYANLLEKAGWKLKQVLRMPEAPVALHKVVAVPV